MPFYFGWSLLIIFQQILAGWFLYLYLRNLKLTKLASLFGGLTFAFSGFFIAYVVFSLHAAISRNKKELVKQTQSKLQAQVFDMSLFFMIIFRREMRRLRGALANSKKVAPLMTKRLTPYKGNTLLNSRKY